jgi:hypothetical protein
MTPVPKNLSKRQVPAWRRAVALGYNPRVAAAQIKKGVKHFGGARG